MTTPPSDAFSLAMNYDVPVRRSSRSSSRSLTRSPSPKITFGSPTHHSQQQSRPSIRQRKSKRSSVSGRSLAEVVEAEDITVLADANGWAAEKKAVHKPVDWEIPRKALHSSIGFFTLYLYATQGSPQRVVIALTGSLCIIVPTDIIRLNSPTFARIYERYLGFLMRDSEKTKSNGVIWYLIGVIWALTLYPIDIAILAVLLLSWADTAASTFGRLWGRYTPPLPRRLLGLPLAPRKSFAGFTAAALTGAAITAGFWVFITPAFDPSQASWSLEQGVRALGFDNTALGSAVRAALRDSGLKAVHNGGWAGLALVSSVAGLVTAVAEALDLGALDDNLTLPIISGGFIWGFLKLLSWFGN